VESEKRFVTLRVSSKGMRIIDKKGIDTVLATCVPAARRSETPRRLGQHISNQRIEQETGR
jgi:large subunit ribosomal protein L28